jgi:Rrf2 family iron-sulfur cluster assembly transcriptional regulator
MKLTTKGRYAVQAMADIAANATGGEGAALPVSLPDVAARQGISAGYLEQLFAKLRRAGLVASARGVAGGYRLARAADAIRVSEIIEAVDEEIATTACRGADAGCQGASLSGRARCLTHDLWDELGRQIELFLAAVTLEDVIKKRVVGMAAVNAPSELLFSSPVYGGGVAEGDGGGRGLMVEAQPPQSAARTAPLQEAGEQRQRVKLGALE